MTKLLIIPFSIVFLHSIYVFAALLYSKIMKQKVSPKKDIGKCRTIEHIVCFKNESAFIKEKLENLYSLKTVHKIHYTFINDNSDDDTLELLEKYKKDHTTIINNSKNLGKNRSQIKAVNQSESEFLLFTDANVFVTDETITELINGFDDDIGGVTGNVRVTTDLKNQDFSGRYWEIEKKIKEFQTIFGTVIGFDGGLYCVKRENYNLSRENELSDLETAFLIFEQKKKTKYIENAHALELEKRTIKNSLKSRIRASNRVFWSFYRIAKYIQKLDSTVVIHFFLHKMVRYAAAILYILSLPLFIYFLIQKSPILLIIFFLPFVIRLTLECVSLLIGGLIALSGTEYKTWSQAKK